MTYIFTSGEQIRNVLYHIDTLDEKQRSEVFKILYKYMGDGAITDGEFDAAIKELSLDRSKYGLSEYDIESIKKLKAPPKS
jgi:hypothetical protein